MVVSPDGPSLPLSVSPSAGTAPARLGQFLRESKGREGVTGESGLCLVKYNLRVKKILKGLCIQLMQSQ